MMNNIVANKVWLIRQLHLPIDVADEISSYNFYDKEKTNARNKMRSISNAFKSPLMNGYSNEGEWCFWAEYGEKQFQGLNCPTCGNYIVTNNYNVSTNALCSCVYSENTNINIDDYYVTADDIENEEEEYESYREYRREAFTSW